MWLPWDRWTSGGGTVWASLPDYRLKFLCTDTLHLRTRDNRFWNILFALEKVLFVLLSLSLWWAEFSPRKYLPSFSVWNIISAHSPHVYARSKYVCCRKHVLRQDAKLLQETWVAVNCINTTGLRCRRPGLDCQFFRTAPWCVDHSLIAGSRPQQLSRNTKSLAT